MKPPAARLEGLELEEGWKVIKSIEKKSTQTGGTFSYGYIAENANGNKGFLKALDFSIARFAPDPARRIQELVEAFNYERDLLEKCGEKKLKKIVKAIGQGKITIDPNSLDGIVQYIIFELADSDLRVQLDQFKKLDEAWALRSLHQVATGLEELHRIDVAHQDLKPSNVLIFKKDVSKLTDLGRAAEKGKFIKYNESNNVVGDCSYAPPELLYGYVVPDWNARRFGCDAYHLGNLIAFYFGKVNITAAVQDELDEFQRWRKWGGTFQDISPYLRTGFNKVIDKLKLSLMSEIADQLIRIIRELCDPDPSLRGHRKNLFSTNQYSLERYISELDVLANEAEITLLLRNRNG
ncbi:MAG TPA: serine/threonine-protein kinase [Bacteroidota bacterium]|nr:serine/threonine-protein kinase [Bacteroidota bacterium]